MFRGVQSKMEPKQQRLNFSDYSAAEQEADARKYHKPINHVYLLRIGEEWAHYIVNQKKDNYAFYGKSTLYDVYQSLKNNYPDYRPKVIMNEGIAEYLRKRKKEVEIIKARQLTINFKER